MKYPSNTQSGNNLNKLFHRKWIHFQHFMIYISSKDSTMKNEKFKYFSIIECKKNTFFIKALSCCMDTDCLHNNVFSKRFRPTVIHLTISVSGVTILY